MATGQDGAAADSWTSLEPLATDGALGQTNTPDNSQSVDLLDISEQRSSLETAKAAEADKTGSDNDNLKETRAELEVDDVAETVMDALDPSSFPEGGALAWRVVFCSFWIQFIVVGFRDSFGVYQRFFVSDQTFPGSTNLSISFMGTVGACGLSLFGPPSGRIADRFGYQRVAVAGGILIMLGFIIGSFGNELYQMYLSLSLFFMVGFPLAYYPAIAAPGQYFLRRRGIAFGISISGSGLGGFAFSNLSQLMIDKVGWRNALRITGVAGGSIIMLAGAFLKPRLARLPNKGLINLSYFRDKDFLLLFLLQFFASWGFYIPGYFVPAFGTNIGVPATTSALVLSIQNVCSAFGRLFLPLLSELRWTGPMNVLLVSIITLGLSVMLILPSSTSAGQMFAFAAVWGVSSGGLTAVNTIVVANVLGTESLSEKLGNVFLAFLAGQLGGPAVAGAMVDATTVVLPDGTRQANFWGPFLFAGLMIFPCGWVWFVWLRMEKAGWKVLKRV
jgi:MFS family permease